MVTFIGLGTLTVSDQSMKEVNGLYAEIGVLAS